MTDKVIPFDFGPSRVTSMPADQTEPEIGQWYWITSKDTEWNEKKKRYDPFDYDWLGCVTEIGSNYVQFTGIGQGKYNSSGSERVHIDQFDERCRLELNAEAILNQGVLERQKKVNDLMHEVRRLTASLSVPVNGVLPAPAAETNALIHVGSTSNIAEYKQALIKAKTEQLPALFEKIKETNQELANWMSASLIPLKAEVGQLTPAIKAIESRIFNVELYAGLSEEVVRIKDGEPAGLTEKLVLFQRRAYMDEECLADYQTGGMDFKKIEEFDAWLVKPNNLARLLPFPRCIVAFQIRRKEKEREGWTYEDFVRINFEREMDKLTFLYIRNGERVYRLNTAIEFDEKLFPDIGNLDTTQRLFVSRSNIDRPGAPKVFITADDFEVRCQEWDRHEASKKGRDGFGDPKTCLCRTEKGKNYCAFRHVIDGDPRETFVEFNDDTVYYDDIRKHLDEEMAKHNRLVLVLQGLYDRSEILQPHPPYRLSTPAGFDTALRLVYDQDKALTPGEAPDFEAYRAKLNKSLKTGSVVVGQEISWLVREAERENERRRRSRGFGSGYYEVTRYTPYGDPGPGEVARITRFSKKNRKATFKWSRRAQRGKWVKNPERPGYLMMVYPAVPCSIDVSDEHLLNVDAYKPGDYHIFFDDPRTRADYLKWAGYLLEAEEYHAGNRKIGGPEVKEQTTSSELFNNCDPLVGTHITHGDDPACQCGEREREKEDE
jgi:hypothetical protein